VNRLKEWKHLLIPDAIQSVYVLLPAGCLDGSGNMVRSWPTNQSPECNMKRIEFLHFLHFFIFAIFGFWGYIKNNVLAVVFLFSYLQ